MNCNDVNAILDNQKAALDPAQRQEALAHVAVCADCASAWHVQGSLAQLPDLALPADLATRCRAAVAAAPRSAVNAHGGRRFRWVATLTAAAAAAAAVLAILLWPAATTLPDGAGQIATTIAVPPVQATASTEPAPGMLPAVLEETSTGPRFTVRLVPYEAPTEARFDAEGMTEAQRSFVRAMHQAQTSDVGRVQVLQSLYTALVDELSTIPGLALLETDPTELTPSSRHFRLTIQFLTVLGANGQMAPIDNRYVSVALGIEKLQPDGKFVRSSAPNSASIDRQASCSGAVPAADVPCRDVRGTAATLVQLLRNHVFPPDPTVTHPLQARFQDSSLEAGERLKALEELFSLQSRTGVSGLLRDAGLVRAAIDLARAADPVVRAQLWRSLRGVGDGALIEPMIASLLQDPEDVRLAAIETLAADFPADPRVLSALERVAQADPRPLVRAVAQRGLSGEETWRQYVTASLKDHSQPAPQRVEALVYYLYPPGPTRATSSSVADYFQIMTELLDDDAVRALAQAIPDSDGLGRGANNLLGNFSSRFKDHPAVPEMLLRVLANDPKPLMRAVAAQNLARFHASDPHVREALDKALASDPEPRVRDAIRSVLGTGTP